MHSNTMKKLLSWLTVFAMVFGMIAMVQPMKASAATAEIAIGNGDFENGAFGGAVSGSNGASIVEKATYEGNYALKFDAKGEILTVTGYLAEATTAESTVTLSLWAKVLSGSTGNSVNVNLYGTNESWGNRVAAYGAGYPTVGGDWKQITKTLTIPVGTKIIQAEIFLGSEGTTAIIDNVSITDGSGNEILHSGGFEKGALNDDFNANDALEIVCTPVHSGSYAAHADKTSGNGNVTTTVSIEASSEAREMTLSYWLYVTPGATNSAHNGIFCYDTVSNSPSWTLLTQKYGVQHATPGVWTQMSLPVAVAANTDTVQIQIYAQDDGANFYIDDLVLTEEVPDAPVNHDVTLSLNQVTGDGTWQFGISEAPANKYYKVPATIDGVACNFLMGESGGIMCVYPNFFTALGGAVPTQQIIIAEGAVLKAVDPDNGWNEIEGADTLTIAEKIDLSYVDGAWGKTVYSHDVTLSLNQVTGDGTWQFAISEAPANKYYKVPAIIDGVECNFLMGESGGIMCVYPNFFTALGGAVPTQQIIIEAGTVLKAADPNNGWNEIEGADTYTLTETIDLSYVNSAWGKTVYTTDVTLSLNQVTGDGTWQFEISEAPANKYYKVPATIDGVACNFLMGESGGIMCVYPNFFTALGGAVPTESIVIAEGTVLTAADPNNGWNAIEGANTLTVSEKIDLSCVDGVWGITVPNQDAALEFGSVQQDGTWQFVINGTPADKYYKVPAIIDGVACSFLMGESGGLMCVYPNFFTVGGSVPTKSLVIEAGAVLKAVDPNNGWAVIAGAETITLTNTVKIENILGSWLDMSQYADVSFEEVNAADLIVYKAEDQAQSNYRSVLGIYAPDAQFGNDANWGNFTKVAGKVLVDGVEVSVVYGMAPGADGDSSWGANNAILLYITGEGYWDAVTTASSVTVCAGTMLVSGVDNTKGVKFAEDFVMYRNCDGSWDTTADTHVYNQQNTELEGALVSGANCQSAATYYYSCSCGKLGDKTFTYGEVGDHNYVGGTCQTCGDMLAVQNITISLQTVTGDGTWQLIPSAVPGNSYYKLPAVIDGVEHNVLVQYGSDLLLIYPNFFEALGGAVPAESFKIPAGTVMKAVDPNGWVEIEGATALNITAELRIENVGGKWVEMSKFDNVDFVEIHAADLEVFYQNIMKLEDYTDTEINTALLMYPEYKPLYEKYGRNANMTTIGIKSVNPDLKIPSDASWATFTMLGAITVTGADPAETYVMQTVASGEDAETAMDNAFLVRFYNGYILENATKITIEPGTKIVTKDGTAGFVFVDGYTICSNSDNSWANHKLVETDYVDPTYTETGLATYTCSHCGEVVTEVIDVYDNPVLGWNIVLGDNIGVNFVLDTGLDVVITVDGAEVEAASVMKPDGYHFAIELAAAQMTSEIAITIEGMATPNTYSVRDYADYILDEANGYDAKTVALVEQMLNYGAAAQNAFGVHTDKLANANIEITTVDPTGAENLVIEGSADGIAFYGASLVYRDKIAVRFYFTGSSEGITGAVEKNGMFYIEVADILPQNLEDTVSVEVGGLTVSYSPLTYIVRMFNKATSSDNTKALVKALYNYYLAAEAYIG